jgi:heme-degrading monooxygenase HmoA
MIFVFEVHVQPGYSAEEYASAWVRASEIIQSAPGARGTRLHRKIGDPNVLVAIASWDSKPARDSAEAQRDPRVQAILDAQSQLVEIRLIGEFEDPEWVVLPQGASGSAEARNQ